MRTILITGATGAIGSELALVYANKHTQLLLTGRKVEKLAEIAKRCEKKGSNVIFKAMDITDQQSFIEWIEDLKNNFSIDLVIANAGTNATLVEAESTDNFTITKKVFDTNLYGVLATITPLIQQMKNNKKGQIAIISSLASYIGLPQSAAYCASKAALNIYGESLRAHLSLYNIKVNVILPGFVKSAMSDTIDGPKPLMLSPKKAAKIIKKGLAKNKARITFPKLLSTQAWFFSLLPAKLKNYLLTRMNHQVVE